MKELQLDLEETRTQYLTAQKRVKVLEEHLNELNGRVGKAGGYEAKIAAQEREISDLRGHIATLEMQVCLYSCLVHMACGYVVKKRSKHIPPRPCLCP
jgi:hypothetical protein